MIKINLMTVKVSKYSKLPFNFPSSTFGTVITVLVAIISTVLFLLIEYYDYFLLLLILIFSIIYPKFLDNFDSEKPSLSMVKLAKLEITAKSKLNEIIDDIDQSIQHYLILKEIKNLGDTEKFGTTEILEDVHAMLNKKYEVIEDISEKYGCKLNQIAAGILDYLLLSSKDITEEIIKQTFLFKRYKLDDSAVAYLEKFGIKKSLIEKIKKDDDSIDLS